QMQRLCVRSSIIHLFVVGSVAWAAVSPSSNTVKCCESSPGCFDGDQQEKIQKQQLTSTASRSSPSTSGYEAAAMCVEGEWKEMTNVLPGTVADAEMAAMLQRAAKEIRLEWVAPPCPEPSRLDDWVTPGHACSQVDKIVEDPFLGQNTVHSLFVPHHPQRQSGEGVYRDVMHLCPQNTATCRGRPRLPSGAYGLWSSCLCPACHGYPAGLPSQELLQELRSTIDYALRATKVTVQALGKAMPTVVVQECHLWPNLAEMHLLRCPDKSNEQVLIPDAEKVYFLDAPISQVGLFGDIVEEFAQQFSTVKKQMKAIKHILHGEAPLREQLRPRSKPVLQLDPPNSPVLAGRPKGTIIRLQSIPEMGSPEERDRLNCLDPHSTRGRALDSAPSRLSAIRQTVTTCISDPPCEGRMLFFPPNEFTGQNSQWSLGLLTSSHRPHVTGVTPLRLQVENFLHWLNLHNPSRWLLRTIQLGYAIHFTRRPPKTHTFTPFLRFAFEGRAYQYKVLPFGLSLSPHVFTKGSGHSHSQLNWLILAHSDVVLNHLGHLGLRVNWEKSKLSPAQSISFPGVELDLVNMTAHLSQECAQSALRCVRALRLRSAVPLKYFQRLLGHMASSGVVTPLGLMHMRPLQHWLHFQVPRWAWCQGTYRVNITPLCRKTFSPWEDILFLRSGVPLEQVSGRIIVTTDASKTGWGAVCNGHAASGVWTGPRVLWHINCLELLTVLWALERFRPLIQSKHVLICSDNTATVAYINHQGSQFKLCGRFSIKTDFARRRVEAPPSVGPADLELVRPGTRRSLCLTGIHSLPVMVRSNRGSPWYRCIGTLLAEGPTQISISPSEPHCTNLVQSQGAQRTDSSSSPILTQQNLVLGPCAPIVSSSLVHFSKEGPPLSGEGHNLASAPRSLEPPPMVPGRDQEDLRDLPPSVVNTLLQARAPSSRRLYDLKWRIFMNWCSSQGKDPRRCGIESVLSFLQGGLDRHLSASTLKVHVAAISANHDLVEGTSVGKHNLVIRFLDPFEPIQSVDLNALFLKMALLTAFTSVNRVGELQALSINSSCLEFGPADSHIVLRPRPGYVPKGGQQKGKAVSKQRVSHWLVDAIRMAYQARGLPCPLGVRAHSTRGVAASAALANGASLTDNYRAEGWATPNTFARFYNLCMESVSTRVLNASSSTQHSGLV
ncbi:hypothetical protein M9458_056535, partial [Cirrhinus mrigala]